MVAWGYRMHTMLHLTHHQYGHTQAWTADLTVICRNSVIDQVMYKAFGALIDLLFLYAFGNHEHGVICQIAERGFDPQTFGL